MRSLHVISTPARRGAETFAVELCQALRQAGDEAAVVALSPTDTGECHDVPTLGRSRRSPETLSNLRRLAALADVTVAHGSSTLEACAVGLAGSGCPFVYRSIGDPSYWVSGPVRTSIIGCLHRRAAQHVALWSGAAERLTERYSISAGRITVIPNATDPERWPRASSEDRKAARDIFGIAVDRPCLAFVGSLSVEKDVDAVLETALHWEEVQVLLAGDGPERTRLEARAAAGAPRRIRFLGAIKDPFPVYAAADLLLLPSRSEGMPAVIIEAGMVGTATVATAVGAVPEMISDRHTGFLVLPRDTHDFVDRVADALFQARAAGANASADFRRRFGIGPVAARWQTLLQRVAE